MATSELLRRFTEEILSRGPEACLPANLDDEWLQILRKQGDAMEQLANDENVNELLAAVFSIVAFQSGRFDGSRISVKEQAMREYLMAYRLELMLEALNRNSSLRIQQATLETIFSRESLEYSVVEALSNRLDQ